VPTIQTLTLLGITGVFNIFDPVFVLINSGNYEALDVLMYYIKTQGVDRFRMGYASAVSVFVFALIFITTLLTKQTVRYRV
jgi:ABC-type sugar transport system permease subunit